jgi:hypothetical protein
VSKQAANNARKSRGRTAKYAEAKAAAEVLKTEAEATEELKTEVNADAVDLKAEAAEAEAEAAEVPNSEAAEALKTEAEAAVKEAEVVQTEVKTEEVKTETLEDMKARIKAEREALNAKRAEFELQRKALIADAKAKREIDAELKALEKEKADFEALQNKSIDEEIEEESVSTASMSGKDFKVIQSDQEKLMIEALRANGNSVNRIGILREYWKSHNAEFRAITKEKQQKAIMRRTLNRMKLKGIVNHADGSTVITLNTEKLKTEDSK